MKSSSSELGMSEFIPVNTPLLDGSEKRYLLECIDSGWISSEGPYVREFEHKFADLVGRRYAVSVTSGSAALEVVVTATGIVKDDEVIMPTFTIISCINPLIRVGAVPVLVDADPITWNTAVGQIEEKITPRTKAIMAVHTYGLPVDMDPVLALAKAHDLMVIEDAAEAIGLDYKGKACGSFGDVSTFSFYPNKLITTGEGGMIVTDDERIAEKCRSLRNLCFQAQKRFVHEKLGWNFRMTNLQAALGLAQLERLEQSVQKKRWIGRRYNEVLTDLVDIIQLPCYKTEYAENIYWVYGIVPRGELSDLSADIFMRHLKERGIGSRPFFWPIHEQPVFRKANLFQDRSYPVSERIARKGFYIPSGLGLKEDDVFTVAEKVKEVLSHYS
tara:strand:- start:846 stop:2006 length:1161 start_codon:yes stop_codon:yes gene_type:complete